MRPSVEHKKLHQENILDYLNRDRKGAKRHCDRVLQSEGKNYSVHESILGAASDYVRAKFDVEKKEKYVKVVPVDKIPPDRLENILDYAYLGDIEVTEDNVMDVLEDAEYTQMKDLMGFCNTCILQIISVDNCLKLRAYAQRYNLDDVLSKTNQTITENFRTVLKQEDFVQLDFEGISTIIKQRLKTCEEAVFTGIVQWVNHNPLEREELFVNLFSQLDLTLLSSDFLTQLYDESLVQNSLVCNKMLVAALLKPSNPASDGTMHEFVWTGGRGSGNADLIYDVNTKQFRQIPDNVYPFSHALKEKPFDDMNDVEQSELEPKVAKQEKEQAKVNERKVYDRTFLMRFRFHKTSMEKPKNLSLIKDIIIDRPLPKTTVSNAMSSLGDIVQDGCCRSVNFTPKYMSGYGGNGHAKPVQQRFRKNGGKPKPNKKIQNLPDQTEFHEGEMERTGGSGSTIKCGSGGYSSGRGLNSGSTT